VNPLTGQPLTLYNLAPSLVGKTQDLITNIPLLNNNSYNGFEIDATKQMSRHFALLGGFTVQRQLGEYYRGSANEALSDNFNDPNLNINRANNYLNYDSTYVFKIDATYQLPMGFGASVNFQHYTGYPEVPQEVYTGLNQGPETVNLEAQGKLRLPSVDLLDMRISRTFTFKERLKVEPLVDFYNMTNAQTVVAQVTTIGPAYLEPSNTINPFLARIGMQITF
jgi:hypothetical protein